MAQLEVKITGLPPGGAGGGNNVAGQAAASKEFAAQTEKAARNLERIAKIQITPLGKPAELQRIIDLQSKALAEAQASTRQIAALRDQQAQRAAAQDAARHQRLVALDAARAQRAQALDAANAQRLAAIEASRVERAASSERRAFDKVWDTRRRNMEAYWASHDRLQEVSARKALAAAGRLAARTASLARRGATGGLNATGSALGSLGGSLGGAIGSLGSGGISGIVGAAGSAGAGAITAASSGVAGLAGSIPVIGGALSGATQLAGGVLAGATQAVTGLAQGLVDKALTVVKVGIAAGIGTAIAAGVRAAKAEPIANAFEALNQAAGTDGPTALGKLRAAVNGTVDDLQLMLSFNRAVTLGAAQNADDFANLAGSAVKLGRAVGRDAKDALEDLTLGIGRQSKLILDNLGIIVSTEDAYSNYASSVGKTVAQLTSAEKKLAFQQEAFRRIREEADRTGNSAETFGEKWQRLSATMLNTLTEAGKPLLDVLGDFVPVLTDGAKAVGSFLSENRVVIATKLKDALSGTLETVRGVVQQLKEKGLKGFFTDAVESGTKFATSIWDRFKNEAEAAFVYVTLQAKASFADLVAELTEIIDSSFTGAAVRKIQGVFSDGPIISATDLNRAEAQSLRERAEREYSEIRSRGKAPERRPTILPLPEQVFTPQQSSPAAAFARPLAFALPQPLPSQTTTSAAAPQGATVASQQMVLPPELIASAVEKGTRAGLSGSIPAGLSATDAERLVGSGSGARTDLQKIEEDNSKRRSNLFYAATDFGLSESDSKKIFNDDVLSGLETDGLVASITEAIEAAKRTADMNKLVEEITRDRVAAESRIAEAIKAGEQKQAEARRAAEDAISKTKKAFEDIARAEEEIAKVRKEAAERTKQIEAEIANALKDRLKQIQDSFRAALPSAISDPALPRNLRRGLEKGERQDDRQVRDILRRQFGSLSSQEIAASPRLRAEVESGVIQARTRVERPIEEARDFVAKRDFAKALGPEVKEAEKASSAALEEALAGVKEEVAKAEESLNAQIEASREVVDVQSELAAHWRETADSMVEILKELAENQKKLSADLEKVNTVINTLRSSR